ncbi:hypothetical protein Zmor_005761 [Zophobas morio]|uniref:Uncharacterized protein n=1 Tax=Zophobas morio TaxID=2755281 RepID=A0AA38INW4_9CUCU|nr:hypothetical protein Zmor_005761 [Zophobas morio]
MVSVDTQVQCCVNYYCVLDYSATLGKRHATPYGGAPNKLSVFEGAQVFSMHRALYYQPTRPIAMMATGSVNRTLQLFPELFAEISLDFGCRNL